MRDYAQLEVGQPVLLSGALNHIDVWNPTMFAERVQANAEQAFAKDQR
jgi:DNA-binding transcriptional regulator/RsmH inhibitor MraZ